MESEVEHSHNIYDSNISNGLTTFYDNANSDSLVSVADYTSSLDLVDFLAVAKHRRFEILPFQWTPISDVGLGGAAKVTHIATVQLLNGEKVQDEVDIVMKRFQTEGARYQDIQKAYQGLLSEVYVLGHPVVRQHPNINRLEGIAWEVVFGDAWPVLLFKKAQYGDLRQFMNSAEGQKLSFDDRVKFCLNIGNALALIHSCNCIHGDLKPENILIFKDEDGGFCAKVTDFGFSSIFARENESSEIMLARSWPWTAPEIEVDPRVTFKQAKSADAFSYGLICAWLLCYDKLPDPSKRGGPNMEAFATLKKDSDLVDKVMDSTRAYLREEPAKWVAVVSLFKLTLVHDPDMRDLEASVESLGTPFGFKWRAPPLHEEYVSMLSQLRLCGEEVRKTIFESFERRAKSSSDSETTQKAAYDLALSYYIGFGTGLDKSESVKWLKESGQSQESLDSIVAMMAADAKSLYYLVEDRVHAVIYLESQRAHARLNGPPSNLHNSSTDDPNPSIDENIDLNTLGDTAIVSQLSRNFCFRELGWIDEGLGRWKPPKLTRENSKDIDVRIQGTSQNKPLVIGEPLDIIITPYNPRTAQFHLEVAEKGADTKAGILGPEHEDTQRDMITLYQLYYEFGLWDHAESLVMNVIDTQQRILGPENPATLRSMEYMAKVLLRKQLWKEAVDLIFKIVDIRLAMSRVRLEDHAYCLGMLGELMTVSLLNSNEMKGEKVRSLEKIIEIYKDGTLKEQVTQDRGEFLLLFMGVLAYEYMDTREYKKAERLLKESISREQELYGKGADHARILATKQHLAEVYLFRPDSTPEMTQDAHRLLIEVRKTLSKPHACPPFPMNRSVRGTIDFDAIREENERLWSFISDCIDTTDYVDRINSAEEALEALPEDSPDRTDVLAKLMGVFFDRFQAVDDPDDLDAAIMWAEQALLVTPDQHPNKARRLADLSSVMWGRYALASSSSDFEASIRYMEEAVFYTNDEEEFISRLQTLAARLNMRFKKSNTLDDLNKALVFTEQAVLASMHKIMSTSQFLAPDSGPALSLGTPALSVGGLPNNNASRYIALTLILNELYMKKWELLNDINDLNEAIRSLESLDRVEHQVEKKFLLPLYSRLGHLYVSRIIELGDEQDVDKAIAKFEECFEIERTVDWDDVGRYGHEEGDSGKIAGNLALLYVTRFSRSNDIVDLVIAKEKIELADASVALENGSRRGVDTTKALIRRMCENIERAKDWADGIWSGPPAVRRRNSKGMLEWDFSSCL